MRFRSRTLLLAGVASLGMSGGALAQVTVNGAPATISSVSQIVWNSTNISTGNPLPVAVVSGGGTGGTSTGPYYVGQYNATLPTFTTAQVGYVSLDANGRMILAPSSSISVSNFPASQAVTNAGTFAVQVSTSALPTGAATSANQTSEISALGAPGDAAYAGTGSASIIAALKGSYIRASTFADAAATAVAASGSVAGAAHDLGSTQSAFTKFNAVYNLNQTGTYFILGSNDNFTTQVIVATGALSASATTVASVPVTFRYYRASLTNTNGTTGGTATISSSFTAN